MIQKYEIYLHIDEIVENNEEDFLDLLSNLCVGNDCLMDITYKPIMVNEEGLIVLSVIGDDKEAVDREYENPSDALKLKHCDKCGSLCVDSDSFGK
jgi:hypothetical protein